MRRNRAKKCPKCSVEMNAQRADFALPAIAEAEGISTSRKLPKPTESLLIVVVSLPAM
jgi:hypothetical protein